MDKMQIADIFTEIAELMELQGENVFKIRAYLKAARALENLNESIQQVYQEGRLQEIEGIGKAIAEKIGEAIETGVVEYHQELKKSLPEGIPDLMKLPSMGPKKAKLVYEHLGISTVEELKAAALAGRLRELPGMGKKSEEKILKGISLFEQHSGRHHIGVAFPIAEEIMRRIASVKGVHQLETAGSLRRGRETVGDVDILVSTDNGAEVMAEFLRTGGIREILAQGSTKSSILLSNHLQVDLRVVPRESFGAALQYFTGSKEHNVKLREMAVKKGIKINEYGVFKGRDEKRIGGEREEDVYQALGLHYIPPELREGFDELELAKNELPDYIDISDIRCALHNHTTASDGKMELEELVREAKRRGFEYIAVTDHSVALGVANGLSEDRLRRQMEEIHLFNETQKKFTVLSGNEVDILADGSLPYSDDLLAELDLVIASVHMSQDQPRDKLMPRIYRAMEHPSVDILAHPSGRLIGRRPAMDIDWDGLYAKAAETGTILEINANYHRLDLNDQHIMEAKQYGVLFSIETDTHSPLDFDHLKYGIKMARRGRLLAQDVLNTLPLRELKKRIKHGRKG
ncbi:MAG: DNA polymerase/3'-5' exonuclease PolX [bacterium]|jgi:DNA polymerase (family 10)